MATYAIGDVQGCLSQLKALLKKINFSPEEDHIYLLGDLVNRGPESLQTLRFLIELGDSVTALLGNHDLHSLACYHDPALIEPGDTIQEIIAADDHAELMTWLRTRALVHLDEATRTIMLHAGIAPGWTVKTLFSLAKELEQTLQSDNYLDFISAMYGNTPSLWDETLTSHDRLRFITNALTRLRFCDAEGNLLLKLKMKQHEAPEHARPWFTCLDESFAGYTICFGHWAALDGTNPINNVYGIDTGCVWGAKLSALRLEDKHLFQVAGLA